MLSRKPSDVYHFGQFSLDPNERLLLCEGKRIPLTDRAFHTLLVLIQNRGKLVEKARLMTSVWGNTFVEEANLSVTISMIRKAIGDDGDKHKYIETVPKHGYRFLGDLLDVNKPQPKWPARLETSPRLSMQTATGRKSLIMLKIGVCLIGLIGLTAGVMRLAKPGNARKQVRSLAVLPFQLLNPDGEHNYIGVGLADFLITELARSSQIIVRPTVDVLKYAGIPASPLAVGGDLKVDAILTGHLEILGDRIRVTAQFVRVGDGSLIWADSYEETIQRLPVLEDEIASRLSQTVFASSFAEANLHPARRDTQNSKARQLYMEGIYFAKQRGEVGVRRSIDYFQQAIAEDPQYARAYASLGQSLALLAGYWGPPSKVNPTAKNMTLKALQLDPLLPSAHLALGMINFYYDWDWAAAEREFDRSIALEPYDAEAHALFALFLASMGRHEEALDQAKRAQELDPVSLVVNTALGWVPYVNKDYNQAIDAYHSLLYLDPQFARAHTRLGLAEAAKKNFREAMREFEEAQRIGAHEPFLQGGLGYAQASLGNTSAALRLLEELTIQARGSYLSPYDMALICVGLGKHEAAMEWLNKAFQDRSADLAYAKVDPLLDPLRSEPRFAALLQRMGYQL